MKNPDIINDDEATTFIDKVYADFHKKQKSRRRKTFAFIAVASVIAVLLGAAIGLNLSI